MRIQLASSTTEGESPTMATRHLNLRKQPIVALRTCCCALAIVLFTPAEAQEKRLPKTPPTPGPMLDQGTMDIDTPDFTLSLVRSSQTVAALKPNGAAGLAFTPGDFPVGRSQTDYSHVS